MNAEAVKLYERLCEVQKDLTHAREVLEACRKSGISWEQKVVSLKNEVHSIKDQLQALAGKESK